MPFQKGKKRTLLNEPFTSCHATTSSPYGGFSRRSRATVTLRVENKLLHESVTGSIEDAFEHATRIAAWIHRCAVLGQPTPAALWSSQPSASWTLRTALRKQVTWAIPDPHTHTLAFIMKRAPRILEIGAGSGYWARRLSDLGAIVTAIDDVSDGSCQQTLDKFYPVTKAEGAAWLGTHRGQYDDHALFFCWPRSSAMMERCVGLLSAFKEGDKEKKNAAAAVEASSPKDVHETLPAITDGALWKGQWVFVIGEGEDGCTGSLDSYMVDHENEWEAYSHDIPCWWGVHDSLQAYRRRGT
jgi:hypothetical protein